MNLEFEDHVPVQFFPIMSPASPISPIMSPASQDDADDTWDTIDYERTTQSILKIISLKQKLIVISHFQQMELNLISKMI